MSELRSSVVEGVAHPTSGLRGHHRRPSDVGERRCSSSIGDKCRHVMDAAGPLHDLGEARRCGVVDLDELYLDLAPLAVRRRVIELACLTEVIDVARRGVVAHEERPAPPARRTIAPPHGCRPRRRRSARRARSRRRRRQGPPSSAQEPNSPTGSPVPRRWQVSLRDNTLRSPLRRGHTVDRGVVGVEEPTRIRDAEDGASCRR